MMQSANAYAGERGEFFHCVAIACFHDETKLVPHVRGESSGEGNFFSNLIAKRIDLQSQAPHVLLNGADGSL